MFISRSEGNEEHTCQGGLSKNVSELWKENEKISIFSEGKRVQKFILDAATMNPRNHNPLFTKLKS